MHNATSADIMPCVVTCAVNPNDVMCGSHDMHMLASWVYLCNYFIPTITYWTGVQACQPTTTRINCLTFWVLINENANKNMPKRVLVAMHNGNKANFNENWIADSAIAIHLLYKL